MPFGLGFFATAGAGAGAAGSFDLLETQILGSTSASVTFSNLNSTYGSTYQHLQLRMVARSERASFDRDLFLMEINSDTGSNYAWHGLVGAGNAVYSTSGTSQIRIDLVSYLQASQSPSGAFSAYSVDLLDPFETTKTKVIRSLSGGTVRSSEAGVALSSGLWNNTNAMTTIKVYAPGNLSAGSRFSLYGIKAA